MIRGTKHGTQARQLVDFLLSEETEIALARSKSRQIPLGPVAAKYLPHDTRGPSDTPRLSVPGPEAADYLSSDVRWMIDSARRKNTIGMLSSLNIMMETRDGFEATTDQYAGWLREAGFQRVTVRHVLGPTSMVFGFKD